MRGLCRLVGGWHQTHNVVFAILFFMVVLPARPSAGPSSEAVQHFNLGNKAFQSGDLVQAEREYRAALKIDPTMVDARQNLAIALAQKGDLGGAAEEFRNVVTARPNSAEAHYNLGRVLFQQKNGRAALAEFRRAVKLKPDYPEARNNIALLLEQGGDREAALAEFRSLIATSPRYAEARNNYGQLLLKEGKLNEAVEQFRTATGLRPDFPQAHENLGLALLEKTDKEGARSEFQKAADLGSASAYVSLGVLQGENGDLDAAIRTHQEAVRLMPNDPMARFLLGGGLQQKGDLDGAILEYGKVLRLDPQFSSAYLNLGVALREKGNLKEATSALETAARSVYNVPTIPQMSTGATDMAFLRAKGIACYGVGAVADVEDTAKGFAQHSDQERILEEAVYKHVQFFREAVTAIAGTNK